MLHRMLLGLLALSFAGELALADELTPSKRADIERLLELTNSTGIAKQFASAISQQMFQALKAAKPEIPDRALAIMDEELMALLSEQMSAPGGLTDQVVPIYDRYFTHQEIQELLAFYRTPLGQKTIAVLPQVVNDSILAGQRWAQSLAPEMQKRVTEALQREGLLPEPL